MYAVSTSSEFRMKVKYSANSQRTAVTAPNPTAAPPGRRADGQPQEQLAPNARDEHRLDHYHVPRRRGKCRGAAEAGRFRRLRPDFSLLVWSAAAEGAAADAVLKAL